MHFQGVIKKMISEFDSPVRYYLNFDDDILCMNQILDKKISIECIGYECLSCSSDSEIYRQLLRPVVKLSGAGASQDPPVKSA